MSTARPVDKALAKLEKVRQTGQDQWEARCPAHEDRSPSLSVSIGTEGRALLCCQAGCELEAILAALDLSTEDLFPPRQETERSPNRIATAYPYRDEAGELLYEVVRLDPKGFRQRRTDGAGGWEWRINGTRRVLYRLPEVRQAITEGRRVWIVEGEKDADALADAGEVATCNPQGAGKWDKVPDAAEQLAGTEVIVWVDDDHAGHAHGRQVVASIDGTVAQWDVVRSAVAKDAAEHLGAGRELETLEVLASADGDRSWLDGPTEEPDETRSHILEKYQASEIDWAEFWKRDLTISDWLVEPLLPRGRGIATYSAPKAGKSVLTLDVVARLATGQRCLDQAPQDPIHVLYVDAEMTADDVYERLEDMGYGPDTDLSHLHYQLLPDLPPLDTPDGGRELAQLAEAYEAELVVIDTVASSVAGAENDSDTFRNYWAYTGRPLKASGCTVWRLDHSGKDPTKGQRGSSAKAGDVDVVWELILRDDAVQLRATHRRVGWVPERVELARLADPLRHERAVGTWPAGTKEKADLLDELGVPIDAPRRDASAAIRNAGHTAGRNDVLQAALRWRRQQQEDTPT